MTYNVTIDSTFFIAPWRRMVDWCNENVGEDKWDWCRFESSIHPTFRFPKEEDATAFKLTFGT